MDIYQLQNLSEKTIKNFRPTRLLIKELAGQYYFCKSMVQDVATYTGSGVIWGKRIKKYGKKSIKTLWISDWYYDANLIQEVALQFSRENQIVESKMWANMRPENGINGGGLIGEANPNYKPEKILWYNNETNETHYWTRKEFHTATGARPQHLLSGKTKFIGPWSLTPIDMTMLKKGENHPSYDTTIYSWVNKITNQTEQLTRYQLVEKYSLRRGNINALINRSEKSYKGWHLADVDQTLLNRGKYHWKSK